MPVAFSPATAASLGGMDTETLWLEFRGRLRSFVARRVSNPADVDDLVQWVFLRLHRSLPDIREGERILAWLYRTARRAIADHYRSASRRRELPSGDALDLDALPPAPRPGREPVEGEGLEPMADCLGSLVQKLPAPYREALVLTDLKGLRFSDAAAVATLSLSGMKSRVQRARRKLRAMLLDCCHLALDRRGGLTDCVRREPARGECGASERGRRRSDAGSCGK